MSYQDVYLQLLDDVLEDVDEVPEEDSAGRPGALVAIDPENGYSQSLVVEVDEATTSRHFLDGESRLPVFVDTGYQEGVVTLPPEFPHHPLGHEFLPFREAGLVHDHPNSQQGQSPTPPTTLS